MPHIHGRRKWEMTRDKEGHRDYRLTTTVKVDNNNDGPAIALSTPGIPLPGSVWAQGNDVDLWAFCYPDAKVIPVNRKGEKDDLWRIEQKFSTKPLERCNTTSIENPLNEPDRIGGSFVKYVREATHDKNDKALYSRCRLSVSRP